MRHEDETRFLPLFLADEVYETRLGRPARNRAAVSDCVPQQR